MTASPTAVRQLADSVANAMLEADPFLGTAHGLRDYDARVPDPSAAAEERFADELASFIAQADTLEPVDAADAVTRDVIRAACDRRRSEIMAAATEYTVTAMPIAGPPELLSTYARTVLPDVDGTRDYLERVRRGADWIDGTTARLRDGAERGRYPIAELVDQAIAWADRTTAAGVPTALTVPLPPADWSGVDAWRAELADAARDQLVPAIGRWRDLLGELRPHARSNDRPGLCSLPGGDEQYAAAIAIHTTLPLSADELHRIGLEHIAELNERVAELGAQLGLADRATVRDRARRAALEADPATALEQARAAVRRAESRVAALLPPPLPAPCAVTPMAATVAEAGMAPHYTRPQPDGSRPGTYWFNTLRPTAGTGWDVEVVAFHETVPGHHSQLARAQSLPDLPLLQQFSMTVYVEGWGLYAERLAGEFGFYSDLRAEIGALGSELHRAARLVVDTGLHAFGWSRQQAIDFMTEHVPIPVPMLVNEVDRYLAWPGQALAYLVGQREILRLREQARARLGEGFELPVFNATVLDSGAVPMPVLAGIVDRLSPAGG